MITLSRPRRWAALSTLTLTLIGTHASGWAASPEARRAAANLPAPTTAAQLARLAPADADQARAAEQVLYGRYLCDDQYEIFVEPNATVAHYVNVRHQQRVWVMRPAASRSGAVRLEDPQGKVLLVQIPFKSMLLNTQTGQRIVDACQHQAQREASLQADREAAIAQSLRP